MQLSQSSKAEKEKAIQSWGRVSRQKENKGKNPEMK